MDPILQRALLALQKGAAPEDVDAWVARETKGQFGSLAELQAKAGAEPPETGLDRLKGFGATMLQGATFRWGDEIIGALGGDRDAFNKLVKKFGSQHKVLSILAEVSGGLAPMLAGGGLVAGAAKAGAGLGTAIGEGMALGGAAGALQGSGGADETLDLGDRAKAALTGGAVGTVLGGATGGLGSIVGSIAKRVNMLRHPEIASANAAIRELDDALKTGGGVEAALTKLDELEKLAPGQVALADLSPQLRRLLDMAVTKSPEAAALASRLLLPRAASQAGRMAAQTEALAGLPGAPNAPKAAEAAQDELLKLGRQIFAPLEVLPEAQPALRTFLARPILKDAARQARAKEMMRGLVGEKPVESVVTDYPGLQEMTAGGRKILSIKPGGADAPGKIIAEVEGEHAPVTMSQMQDVRWIINAARRAAKREGNPMSRQYAEAEKQLVDLMDGAVPGFKSANQLYRRQGSVLRGLEEGQKAWKLDPREIEKRLGQLRAEGGKNAVDGYRYGMVDAMVKDLRNVATNRDAARRYMTRSADLEEKLKVVFPDDATYAKFLKMAAGESEMEATAQAGGNSATARRLLDALRVEGGSDAVSQMVGSSLSYGLPQGLVYGAGRAAGNVLKNVPGTLQEPTATNLGGALMTQGRPGIEQIFELIKGKQSNMARVARLMGTLRGGATTGTGLLGGSLVPSQ